MRAPSQIFAIRTAAFDVNPNPDKDQHVLAIDESDPSPDSTLLIRTARLYRLSGQNLARVETEVRNAVSKWSSVARSVGAKPAEITLMQTVIDAKR